MGGFGSYRVDPKPLAAEISSKTKKHPVLFNFRNDPVPDEIRERALEHVFFYKKYAK